MLKRACKNVFYAMLLLRAAGPKIFLRQLRRQLYSRTTFIGMEKYLETTSVPIPCRLDYALRLASAEDMAEVLQKAKTENSESAHELIQRKWFYESGFRNCYVARTVDTGELCFIGWLISAHDNHVVKCGFRHRLPRMKEDEVLGDNAYTFEKYRGHRLMASVVVQLAEMARRNGFKRMIAQVAQDKIAPLKTHERAGFKKFDEITELKLLFFTRRKHCREYNANTSLSSRSWPRGTPA